MGIYATVIFWIARMILPRIPDLVPARFSWLFNFSWATRASKPPWSGPSRREPQSPGRAARWVKTAAFFRGQKRWFVGVHPDFTAKNDDLRFWRENGDFTRYSRWSEMIGGSFGDPGDLTSTVIPLQTYRKQQFVTILERFFKFVFFFGVDGSNMAIFTRQLWG